MKIKAILMGVGGAYVAAVVLLIILDKRDWAITAVFVPVYLLLTYCFIVFLFSLIAIPFYWVTWPFRKYFIKKSKLTELNDAKIKSFFIAATLVAALYVVYMIVFPDEDYYWDNFKKVTYRVPSPSARLIAKDSAFFEMLDCSSAIIQMTPKHYMKLLSQIQNDNRFEADSGIGGYDSFSKVMGGCNKNDIIHTFAHPNSRFDTDNSIYQIGFFSNQKWVVYQYCPQM
jgi:hypothetical protein